MKQKMKERTEWLLEQYLTLMPEPVEVVFPDGDVKHIGGFGGFSRTFFERGRGCTTDGCDGRCCKRYSAGWWFYLPSEGVVHPERLESEELILNGYTLPILTHGNENEQAEGCQHLCDDGKCDLYPRRHAIVCNMSPHVGVHPYRDRLYWAKRLPPRNWRWPQCPINPAEQKPDIEDDVQLFTALVEGLKNTPGWDERMDDLPRYLELLYDPKIYYALSQGSQLLKFEAILDWFEPKGGE